MTAKAKCIATGILALLLTVGLMSGCGFLRPSESDGSSADTAASASSWVSSEEDTHEQDAPQSSDDVTDASDPAGYVPDSNAEAAEAKNLLQTAITEPVDSGNLTQFSDVSMDAYYYEALLWAVDTGITGGISDTEFAPDSLCTRAQVMTMLYRVAGEPAVTVEEYPFFDVPEKNRELRNAVLWAWQLGVTEGMGEGTFGVDQPVTRLQMVTFLWRMEGEPNPSGAEYFFEDTDAPAAIWAVEQGITNGMSDTEFASDLQCTRGQVVTFLYRFAQGVGTDLSSSRFFTEIHDDEELVTITIPAAYLGAVTREELSAAVAEKGYEDAVLNADGTATVIMIMAVYQRQLATLRGNISATLAAIPGSAEYPTVTSVYANDDYTVFTMQTTAESAEEAEKIPVEELYLISRIFAEYSGADAPETLVIVASEETGEIYREVRNTD